MLRFKQVGLATIKGETKEIRNKMSEKYNLSEFDLELLAQRIRLFKSKSNYSSVGLWRLEQCQPHTVDYVECFLQSWGIDKAEVDCDRFFGLYIAEGKNGTERYPVFPSVYKARQDHVGDNILKNCSLVIANQEFPVPNTTSLVFKDESWWLVPEKHVGVDDYTWELQKEQKLPLFWVKLRLADEYKSYPNGLTNYKKLKNNLKESGSMLKTKNSNSYCYHIRDLPLGVYTAFNPEILKIVAKTGKTFYNYVLTFIVPKGWQNLSDDDGPKECIPSKDYDEKGPYELIKVRTMGPSKSMVKGLIGDCKITIQGRENATTPRGDKYIKVIHTAETVDNLYDLDDLFEPDFNAIKTMVLDSFQ